MNALFAKGDGKGPIAVGPNANVRFARETVALGILEEQKASFNEEFSWAVTRFDGTTITI